MIKIENKKLNIQIFDVAYSISKPKFKDIMEMEETIETMKPKQKLAYIKEKLISFGIPEAVLDELDGDAFVELMEVVNGSKKNSQ
jgi:hypothetical protein